MKRKNNSINVPVKSSEVWLGLYSYSSAHCPKRYILSGWSNSIDFLRTSYKVQALPSLVHWQLSHHFTMLVMKTSPQLCAHIPVLCCDTLVFGFHIQIATFYAKYVYVLDLCYAHGDCFLFFRKCLGTQYLTCLTPFHELASIQSLFKWIIVRYVFLLHVNIYLQLNIQKALILSVYLQMNSF